MTLRSCDQFSVVVRCIEGLRLWFIIMADRVKSLAMLSSVQLNANFLGLIV